MSSRFDRCAPLRTAALLFGMFQCLPAVVSVCESDHWRLSTTLYFVSVAAFIVRGVLADWELHRREQEARSHND